MGPQDHVAIGLADALLHGDPSAEGFAARAAEALGQKHDWIKPFARRMFRQFGNQLSAAQRPELIQFIRDDKAYIGAWNARVKPRIRHYFPASLSMSPRGGALAECLLPDLPAPRDLAEWLGISVPELEWYADTQNMIRAAEGPLCHYRYKWFVKRQGGYRLIESPKPRLCAIQRKILHEILDFVPPHPAAHGFRHNHSCLTYVAPHVGKSVVMRMDLRDFFGSIPAARVHALFTTLGYPDATARFLTGLCTNGVSSRALLAMPAGPSGSSLWLERRKLAQRHLAQGAPTSPALANLCAFHLDCRLAALAKGLDADYTRYADDIAFSGDEAVRRRIGTLVPFIAAIALEEGFNVNFRKTRIMHKSDCQILTGIVVNEKTNIHRREYERLKAILHNCHRLSPQSQNREDHADFRAHLLGRISYMTQLNRQRGEKLKALFERIEW